MSTPLTVTDDSFAADVLASETPVLVDFWAAWCGPCKMVAPVLEEIATEKAGVLTVAKIDVDAIPTGDALLYLHHDQIWSISLKPAAQPEQLRPGLIGRR